MRFRLVIHIPDKAGIDRAGLMTLEERIVDTLAPQHSVHGHDLGRGHLILTIHSDDPEAAWQVAKGAIPDTTLPMAYVFYTLINGPRGKGTEHWLWPPLDEDISSTSQ